MTDVRDVLDPGATADFTSGVGQNLSEDQPLNDEPAKMPKRVSHALNAEAEGFGVELQSEVRSVQISEDSTVIEAERPSAATSTAKGVEEAALIRELNHEPTKTRKSRPKISFQAFAERYHRHRDHEREIELLKKRRFALWKWIGLAQRLRRVGSWVQDGLVDMMFRSDKAGFARVHKSLLALADLVQNHWKREFSSNDSILEDETPRSRHQHKPQEDIFSKLSAGSRAELFSLLHDLRSNPGLLTERIKALDDDQLKLLQESLKPQQAPIPSGHSIIGRSRPSPKLRMEAFSQGLEDYAASFERSSTLSFLLFNVYGTEQSTASVEAKLRLNTWSTICANLFMAKRERYLPFIYDILDGFALLSTWGAKRNIELFLMDILQRGAFLVDQVQNSPASGRESRGLFWNALETDEARQFFDEAVLSLFRVLDDQENGIPSESLQLCRAIIGKLETVDQQSDFRGDCLYDWVLRFLQRAICFPENESILLQYHISKDARDSILVKLFQRTHETIYAGQHSEELTMRLGNMASRLEGLMIPETAYPVDEGSQDESSVASVLVVSARDVVQSIDSLFNPHVAVVEAADPFVMSSTSAFNEQYSNTATRLDKLRREIMVLANLQAAIPTVHPCQESWILLGITTSGTLSQAVIRSAETTNGPYSDCNIVQQAALRLAETLTNDRGRGRFQLGDGLSLKTMVENEYVRGLEQGNRLDALFWHGARLSIVENYPLSELAGDDTRLFESLLNRSQSTTTRLTEVRRQLETSTIQLQGQFDELRTNLERFRKQVDRLRVKMWYIGDVVHSKPYEETRNIAMALANMNVPDSDDLTGSESPSRGRSMAGVSSISLFEPQRRDLVTLFRAPADYGGPQKLSDPQIEQTKRWIHRNTIENFCRGEERIHRFCMEVKSASKRLVAETLTESPDLWSSELFLRERVNFDASVIAPPQGSTSTRPASVISDSHSATMPWSRSAQKQEGSTRGKLSDAFSLPGRKGSFHSVGSGRLPHEYTGTDRSSSGSSPARTVSATTTDAVSSLFSPINGYSQSVTSLSARSRPGSTYNEIEIAKAADQRDKDKSKFLESLQQDLICMLLSDLGSPVWSCGSETDAWLQRVNLDGAVQLRLEKRRDVHRLISDRKSIDENRSAGKRRSNRSNSVAPSTLNGHRHVRQEKANRSETALAIGSFDAYPYGKVFQELLDRFSQEIDPIGKLEALRDFRQLTILQLQSTESSTDEPVTGHPRAGRSLPASRRSSFDPRAPSSTTSSSKASTLKQSMTTSTQQPRDELPERQVVAHMKQLLLGLNTKTLFRDLQYIESFVPREILDKSENSRPFIQFGLAALGYKEEICQSMVDIANSLAGKDLIKRRSVDSLTAPIPLRQAAEYWIIAARENDRVAQRELANLYLSFPDSIPVVTLPLSLSSEIFKAELRWQDANVPHNKLCLALHWMQQAANNGDDFARQQMGIRTKISIR